MCTLVILRRPRHDWPVIIGANRDEMKSRPWDAPDRHWPDRPDVIAGRDRLAGGSWLGMNDQGVVAGILNRANSLGPAADKRSRGELVLEALDHADAAEAAAALGALDGNAYRPFNLVVADNRDAFWVRNSGSGQPHVAPVPEGLSMVTSQDINDAERSARVRVHLPRFQQAKAPAPDRGDWADWERLMASRDMEAPGALESAMAIVTEGEFATTSSSLIALPASGRDGVLPVWRFTAGLPHIGSYQAILPRVAA